MPWTMGQAVTRLAPFARNGVNSVREDIVTAMETLSDFGYWENLRQVIRFRTLSGGRFAIPQQFEKIHRAAVDGTPISVRGIEYNFLYSGPGDMDALPSDYAPAYGLVDEGMHPPLAVAPTEDYFLLASIPDYVGTASLRVSFLSGDRLSIPVVSESVITAATSWDDLTNAATVLAEYGSVDSMVVPESGLPKAQWITLWVGVEDSLPSDCEGPRITTSVKAPQLHYYNLPSASSDADCRYNLLAEVKPAFLRTYDDDDVIPFPTLPTIQFMMQALRAYDEGEVDHGDKFRETAVGFMTARDTSAVTKQAPVTFNSQYDMSPGQDSSYFANI